MPQQDTVQSYQIPQIRVTRAEGEPIEVDVGGQHKGRLIQTGPRTREWEWDKVPSSDTYVWVWSAVERFEDQYGR